MADIRAALKVVPSLDVSLDVYASWCLPLLLRTTLLRPLACRDATVVCRFQSLSSLNDPPPPPVPWQVELPSCLDNPQAPSNTPMARLKRTAERAGALLAFQVQSAVSGGHAAGLPSTSIPLA